MVKDTAKPNLSELTLDELRYLDVFRDAIGDYDYGRSPAEIFSRDDPYDLHIFKQLVEDTKLKTSVAKITAQAIEENSRGMSADRQNEERHIYLLNFITEAQRYLKVKDLVLGFDKYLARAALMYVNGSGDYPAMVRSKPRLYLRNLIQEHLIKGSLIALLFLAAWHFGVTALAVLAGLWLVLEIKSVAESPKQYRAMQALNDYLKQPWEVARRPITATASKQLFVQTLKEAYGEERGKSFVTRIWWLSLCFIIGLVLIYGGYVSYFHGFDHHHNTFDRVFGVVMAVFGLLYTYVYGRQLYGKLRTRELKSHGKK